MDRLLMTESPVIVPSSPSLSAVQIVAALSDRASGVSARELARLNGRGSFDSATNAEITATLERIIDALLGHACRHITEHADTPVGQRHAIALQELFALEPSSESGPAW
ncbi:hypothetical protein ABZ897_57870 [Nonomuraea sp. NPDC046802]|uniref:hypothetical protein n=1 Tax=Nonomuraea sp. NPDC046802 TaxID=3154919 RepID=UPI0033FE4FB9